MCTAVRFFIINKCVSHVLTLVVYSIIFCVLVMCYFIIISRFSSCDVTDVIVVRHLWATLTQNSSRKKDIKYAKGCTQMMQTSNRLNSCISQTQKFPDKNDAICVQNDCDTVYVDDDEINCYASTPLANVKWQTFSLILKSFTVRYRWAFTVVSRKVTFPQRRFLGRKGNVISTDDFPWSSFITDL